MVSVSFDVELSVFCAFIIHGVLVPSLFHHIATAAGSGGSLLFIVAVFRLSPVLRCILLPSLGQTYVLDTVQYSTVQYTEYSTIALVSNVCSGWPSPCWSCPAPPSRRTRCPTHTRTRAPPPSPAPRGDTCRATWSVASPGLASDHDPYYYNETYCNAPSVIIIIVRNKNTSTIYCRSP